MRQCRRSVSKRWFAAAAACGALLLSRDHATAGLMAYWDLDEAGGQVAADWTGVNNGQLGSTPGADANDPLVAQPGRFGTAY